MKGAGADFHVIGLQDHAALVRPEALQRQDQSLERTFRAHMRGQRIHCRFLVQGGLKRAGPYRRGTEESRQCPERMGRHHTAQLRGSMRNFEGPRRLLAEIAISLNCDTQVIAPFAKTIPRLMPPSLLAGLEGWCPTLRPAQVFWELRCFPSWPGFVPAIHVFPALHDTIKTWMPGTGPGMTNQMARAGDQPGR